MRRSFFMTALAVLATAIPASAKSRIKIDTVPAQYTPYLSISREPVSLSGFHFQVNETTGRARIVATYTYAENMIAGKNDGGGPRSTITQIPGLVYDAQSHTVVYDPNGKPTVCATVQDSRSFWGHRPNIKSTNACTVSTKLANVTVDDGWRLHHMQVLKVYFEVR